MWIWGDTPPLTTPFQWVVRLPQYGITITVCIIIMINLFTDTLSTSLLKISWKYFNEKTPSGSLMGCERELHGGVFTHGTMGYKIDPSWWIHWATSCSSWCSITGITKAVVCFILSMWSLLLIKKVHIKDLLLLIKKSNPCSGGRTFPLSLCGALSHVRCNISLNKMCWLHR